MSIIGGFYMDETYHKIYSPTAKNTDGVPEELLPRIDPHWDQFPPVNPLFSHFFGFVYFLFCCISLTGNFLVMYIFIKVKTLRTPSNVFVVNLALSDFCMIFTNCVPIVLNAFMSRFWAWGVWGCKAYAYTGMVFGLGSILTMIAIGYDRYNVIVKGITGTKMTMTRAIIIVLVVWAYSLGISTLALLDIWGRFAFEGIILTCSIDYLAEDLRNYSFVVFVFFYNYVTPMSCIIFFYSAIVKAVWSHEQSLKKQAKKMNVDSLRSNANADTESAEFKIAKVAVTNVFLWILIWTPYTVIVLTGILGFKDCITPLLAQVPSFLTKAASCLNPVVYAISHPKFREALETEVPCLGIKETKGAQGDQKTTASTAPA